MRPRLIKTLKDLKDFLTDCERHGMKLDGSVYIKSSDAPELLTEPTFLCFCEDDNEPFISIEFWDQATLYANAVHCDELGTEDHYIS